MTVSLDGLGGVLGYVIVIGVAIGGAVLGFLGARKREAALRAWAASTGWTYLGTDPLLADRWHDAPFGIGHSRRVSELVVGTFGRYGATSFAYRYTTGSGKNQTTHRYWVCAISLPTFLPTLELTRQGFGARIAAAFGAQDIELESAEFNDAWRVQARDLKFAHDVLHPRMLERLVRSDTMGLNLRIVGTDILCWTSGTPDLDRLAPVLEVMRALADGIPRFVWLDHGYDPADHQP